MIQKVKKNIQDNSLLTDCCNVIVGVSGGADSVALLDILHRLDYKCIVCHCNFHLRNDESMRDEVFVQKLAMSYKLPYFKIDFDTKKYAQENKISIEMAARNLRYDWFEQQRIKFEAEAIAVAHHRNDSVETVLLNLTRGTGIHGLTGIRPHNGNIIRPLLSVSKKEILSYLNDNNLPFVTDSTNDENIYTRNFIRNKIIPLFEELNPDFQATIQRTSEYLSGTEQIYQQAISDWKKRIIRQKEISIEILISELLVSPSPRTILFEILSAYGFNSSVVTEIYDALQSSSGKEFFSHSHYLIKDRDYLILAKKKKENESDQIYMIDKGTKSIETPIQISFSVVKRTEDFSFSNNKNIAYFDFDKIQFPLTLRHWKKGDWFIPFGMKGRKKISDYFSDHKFNLIDKNNAWLLCSGNDIIWLIGERSDNRFKIDTQSENILLITHIL